MTSLEEAYYSPTGGYVGPSKLYAKTGSKVSHEAARDFLKDQAVAQVFRRQKNIDKPLRRRWAIDGKNDVHQADLLFLPPDGEYKYALTLVDVGTRYKAAVPLTSKRSSEVADGLQAIYSAESPLKPPKQLVVDPGSEFKGETDALAKSYKTRLRRSAPGYHRGQAVVESFNRQLAQRIFRAHAAKEMAADKQLPMRWAADLPKLVDAMNGEKTRMLGVSPKEAMATGVDVDFKVFEQRFDPRPLLPPGTKVRVLRPRDERKRATDPIWSEQVYDLDRVVVGGFQPNLYYVAGGKLKHGFALEELQVVTKAAPPPAKVLAEQKRAPAPRDDQAGMEWQRIPLNLPPALQRELAAVPVAVGRHQRPVRRPARFAT